MRRSYSVGAVLAGGGWALSYVTDRHADGRSPRPRIALVTASWHADIVFMKKGEEVARACLDTLAALQTLPSTQPRVN